MKIRIDPDRCQCTGFCVKVAPDVFALRAPGPTEVSIQNPGPDLHDSVFEAEGLCPTHAILVEQENDEP